MNLAEREAFLHTLMDHTERLLGRLGLAVVENGRQKWDNRIADGYTVLLPIRGAAVNGTFVLTMETRLAYSLVNHYILEAVGEDEVPGYADKVIAEVANIIAGSALSDRDDEDICLGVPSVYAASLIEWKPDAKVGPMLGASPEAGIFQCMFIRGDELWRDF